MSNVPATELGSLLRRFVESQFLSNAAHAPQLRPKPLFVLSELGSIATTVEPTEYFPSRLEIAKPGSPFFDELVARLCSSRWFRTVAATRVSSSEPGFDPASHIAPVALLDFVRSVCCVDRAEIDEQAWEKQSRRFIALVESGRIQRTDRFFVLGVEPDQATVIDRMHLIPISPDRSAPLLFRELGSLDLDRWTPLASCHLMLTADYEHEAGTEPSAAIGAQSEANNIVLALRIFQNNVENARRVRLIAKVNDTSANMNGSSFTFTPGATSGRRQTLATTEFAAFYLATAPVLRSPPKTVEAALRRFETMLDQPRPGDRLLDIAIIMEALFQKGDEKLELAYRLSLRVARFDSAVASEQKGLFTLAKKMYDLRSRIAHGDSLSAADLQVQQDADQLIMRALKKYLLRVASRPADKYPDAVCRELDELVVAGIADAT